MVEKFIKWFFSEIDMYGPGMHAGIFGDYIVDKILGTPIHSVDLFVYSDSNQWNNIKQSFINHIEQVWNIFQNEKIKIIKQEIFYTFSVHNVFFRIFWEKPYFRNIFTFQSLQYNWYNKKFNLTHTHTTTDPLFLLKTLNNIKKKKLIPLYQKNLILDHDFFVADRDYYIQILNTSYSLIKSGWYFDPRYIRLHTCVDGVCSICRNEDVDIKLQIHCGHKFHKECLQSLMTIEPEQKHASLCPNCRSPIQIFFN